MQKLAYTALRNSVWITSASPNAKRNCALLWRFP